MKVKYLINNLSEWDPEMPVTINVNGVWTEIETIDSDYFLPNNSDSHKYSLIKDEVSTPIIRLY
jgi:hypothetical protein